MKCLWLAALTVALAFPAHSGTADVVTELSHRTGMSVTELNALLSHCESTQLSMNTCAFRDLVAAEIKMNQLLQAVSSRLDQADRQALAKEQANWSSHEKTKCNMLTDRTLAKAQCARWSTGTACERSNAGAYQTATKQACFLSANRVLTTHSSGRRSIACASYRRSRCVTAIAFATPRSRSVGAAASPARAPSWSAALRFWLSL